MRKENSRICIGKLTTPSSVAPDCFTLFLVFSYGLDVGSTALSSNSRRPVVVTAPSEWTRALKFQSNRKSIFRETRAASPITTKEFDFKKDRHTRGLIHWSENYSKVRISRCLSCLFPIGSKRTYNDGSNHTTTYCC